MILTWLLSYYSLDKLEYSIVANAIIGEHQCLAGVSWPLQSANKISAVKCKPDHPPSWKGKSKDKQLAPSGSGSDDHSKEKKGWSHAGKKVKECQEAVKECQHSHMAEMVMAVDPPAPIASLKAPLPAPTPLPVIMTINSNVGLSPPLPLFQKDFWQLLLPSLYLVGILASRKQGLGSG